MLRIVTCASSARTKDYYSTGDYYLDGEQELADRRRRRGHRCSIVGPRKIMKSDIWRWTALRFGFLTSRQLGAVASEQRQLPASAHTHSRPAAVPK